MDGVVRINLRIRKYLWGEFVYDVCYVLYGSYVISSALSKRFFHKSLGQLVRGFFSYVRLAFWAIFIGISIYLLIAGALGLQ